MTEMNEQQQAEAKAQDEVRAELVRRLWIIVQALEPFTDKDAMDVYLRAEYENLLALSKAGPSGAEPERTGT